jgi:hypothetical protein
LSPTFVFSSAVATAATLKNAANPNATARQSAVAPFPLPRLRFQNRFIVRFSFKIDLYATPKAPTKSIKQDLKSQSPAKNRAETPSRDVKLAPFGFSGAARSKRNRRGGGRAVLLHYTKRTTKKARWFSKTEKFCQIFCFFLPLRTPRSSNRAQEAEIAPPSDAVLANALPRKLFRRELPLSPERAQVENGGRNDGSKNRLVVIDSPPRRR